MSGAKSSKISFWGLAVRQGASLEAAGANRVHVRGPQSRRAVIDLGN